MAAVEHLLDPLLRPPLSLAVLAAGLKYVATVVVLEDPLLLTRSDYVKQQQLEGPIADRRRRRLLLVQTGFALLALRALVGDLQVVAQGFLQLPFTQWAHLLAMVLAFSPNTVAAVASATIALLKARWGHGASPQGLGKYSDLLTRVLGLVMGVCYLLPLALVSAIYGAPGLCAVAYVFICDFLTLPCRLMKGDLGAMWVAVPVISALVLGQFLCASLIGGQAYFFEKRYPDLARRIDEEGARVAPMRLRVPDRLRAQVIGSTRELMDWSDKDLSVNLAAGASGLRQGDDDESPGGASGGLGEVAPPEHCMLNDEVLAFFMYTRVVACLAMPGLQLCVTITAKVFLGDTLWHAAVDTFGERTWAHYADRLRGAGMSGAVTLLWYYL